MNKAQCLLRAMDRDCILRFNVQSLCNNPNAFIRFSSLYLNKETKSLAVVCLYSIRSKTVVLVKRLLFKVFIFYFCNNYKLFTA